LVRTLKSASLNDCSEGDMTDRDERFRDLSEGPLAN
jgi:hypothetical protein